MKARTTQNTLAVAAMIGPCGAAGWTNEPWLAFALLTISVLTLMAFEASYRRWRPWAVEACGLEDPNTITIAAKGIAAEIAVWATIAIGGTGWTLVGIRLAWGLVQLAEIGKFGRETNEHDHHHASSRAAHQSRK